MGMLSILTNQRMRLVFLFFSVKTIVYVKWHVNKGFLLVFYNIRLSFLLFSENS